MIVVLWGLKSEVAFEAEENIDIHVVNQIQHRSQGDESDSDILAFCEDLEKLIQKIDFIRKELSMAEDEEEDIQAGPQHGVHLHAESGSSATSSGGETTAVGFEEHVIQIMDLLTSDVPSLKTIPIVGMGGIGKTTLAKCVFDNKLIVEIFDLRIWLTISQNYSVHDIFLRILKNEDVINHGENFIDEVGQKVHKKLFGGKYLIVMEDLWDGEAWDGLKRYFPDNRNGSRVLVTTRLSDLAISLGSNNPYYLTILDEGKSWNLFCQTIFAQDDCPDPKLAEIGRIIARNCRGLPLEIVVVGSQLGHSDLTPEYWQFVAKNLITFGDIDAYEHCMKVLYLSYNDLPIHLKLCFLYMRVYPEDAKIVASELVTRLIAEGFIKPVSGRYLEEIGKEYIENLASRNLVVARERRNIGSKEIIAYGIHDLFRDLCLRESEKEHFFCSLKTQVYRNSGTLLKEDDCFHCGARTQDGARNLFESIVISVPASQAHYVCRHCEMLYSHLTSPQLLKTSNRFRGDLSRELLQPTRLQYASIVVSHPFKLESTSVFHFTSMFHLLWNLKTLDICYVECMLDFGRRARIKPSIALPPEFWEMLQLRHIRSSRFDVVLPDPIHSHAGTDGSLILKNLQTLGNVLDFKCSTEILNRIPNIKTLGIKYRRRPEYFPCNITQLWTLEVLRIQNVPMKDFIFPSSLKELVLDRCKIPWGNMTFIGSLPNLEVLHLYRSGAAGPEWVPVEGEFLQLKELKISGCFLRWWRAEQIHFPKLEVLELDYLPWLEEIPSAIGDIATLHTIRLSRCSEAARRSAMEICEEQQSMGNESLQIFVHEKTIGDSDTE